MKKKIINNLSKIMCLISCLIFFGFLVNVVNTDVIPYSYIAVFALITSVIYSLLYAALLYKNTKAIIKVISIIMLLVTSMFLIFGMTYIDKTLKFVNDLDNVLVQEKDYYVSVKATSSIVFLDDLSNKKIGVYTSTFVTSNNKAIDSLKEQIEFILVEYVDVEVMLKDLRDDKIDAILTNDAILNMIETEFKQYNFTLRNIINISVVIDEIKELESVNVLTTPFNIYLAGGDSYGSINKVTNTDVNMIISVNPKTREILITSIPRDYYVDLIGVEGNNTKDKLTHAGYYGIDVSIETIENLLDIKINYYLKLNFSTFKSVVDAIGGITVYSEYSFSEEAYGKYHFVKGNNFLNGEAALGFARERKSLPGGDLTRQIHQQKVLTAIIKKITSSTVLISKYEEILKSVSGTLKTNIDNDVILKLIKYQLNGMYSWKTTTQTLQGTDFSGPTYSFPNMNLYVMKPDNQTVTLAKEKLKLFLEFND